MADEQVAVLIDVENVGLNSIQWLFDQVSEFGRIIVKRAYADWSAAGNKRDEILELGIEPIHLYHGTKTKNSSDIRLVIDAIDLLYQVNVDSFVIVSADSDFVPLAIRLRAAGKTVIGAGRRSAAASSLVMSSDRYIDLDQAVQTATPPPVHAEHEESHEALLARALSVADDDGRTTGSKLHQTMRRLDPGFDVRTLGFSSFSRFLAASDQVKVTRTSGSGDMIVEIADTGSAQGASATPGDSWDSKVDDAWSKTAMKSGQKIPGTTAATAAAQMLGHAKLSDSPYRTLQKLLDASPALNEKWARNRSTIIRR